jgi:hypothetical protein
MKSLKNIEKDYTSDEIAESLVFPGSKTPKDREALLAVSGKNICATVSHKL